MSEPEHVHRKRAVREVAAKPRGDRAVEHEARDGANAANHPDGQDDEGAHAVTRARRTRLVATVTAAKPAATLAPA